MYGWNTRTAYWEEHMQGIAVGDYCEDRQTGKHFIIREILSWEEDFDCVDEEGTKHLYRDCKVLSRKSSK